MKSTGVSYCVIEKMLRDLMVFMKTFMFTAQTLCKPLMFLIVSYDNY